MHSIFSPFIWPFPLKLVLQFNAFLFSLTLQALQERMVKDFKSKMKEVQRKHDDEKHKLQKDLDKERQKMKDHKKSIEKEVQNKHIIIMHNNTG